MGTKRGLAVGFLAGVVASAVAWTVLPLRTSSGRATLPQGTVVGAALWPDSARARVDSQRRLLRSMLLAQDTVSPVRRDSILAELDDLRDWSLPGGYAVIRGEGNQLTFEAFETLEAAGLPEHLPTSYLNMAGLADGYVPVSVTSTPPGARVFFIPEVRYGDGVSEDSLDLWEISQGRTDTETRQLERRYAVVFRYGEREAVKRGVRVIAGGPNAVGVVFDSLPQP